MLVLAPSGAASGADRLEVDRPHAGRDSTNRDASGLGADRPAAAPLAAEELAALYLEIESEFRAARAALNAAEGAPCGRSEPASLRLAYAAKMKPLADAGYAPASAWLARHFEASPDDPRAPLLVKRELYHRLLPAEAASPWLFDDELDVLDSLAADAALLGPATTSAFAHAIFAADPPHPFERRLRALTLEAEALAPLGESDPARRQAASEVWSRELERAPEGPFAPHCRDGLWRLRHLVIGQPVPGFSGADVDGNEIRLADFETKVVVVAFFSFERTGDRARAVQSHRLASLFESAPFALVGINQDPKPTLFRKLWEELELRFPCVFEGGRHGAVAAKWHLEVPPKNLVIDRTGILRYVDLDPEALERVVAELTSEPARAGNSATTTPRR